MCVCLRGKENDGERTPFSYDSADKAERKIDFFPDAKNRKFPLQMQQNCHHVAINDHLMVNHLNNWSFTNHFNHFRTPI